MLTQTRHKAMSQQTLNKSGLHHHHHQMSHQHHKQQTINSEQQAYLERLSQMSQDFRPAQQQQQTRRDSPIKLDVDRNSQSTIAEGTQVQRKLFSFLYIYAILIVALYATYAAYYFYQHQRHRQQKQQLHPLDNHAISIDSATAKLALATAAADNQQQDQQQQLQQLQTELEARLESKIHLLERYIEVVAVDLQETKSKLREREKCDCSISCTFNGTRYSDRSSWQNQCDVCTCQAGRISCAPQKCPITNCDDAILLPGQCCPTCMKKCKHNDKLYRHGQKFKPNDSITKTSSQQSKECRCYDGRIRCEQVRKATAAARLDVADGNSSVYVGAIRAAIAAANTTTTTTTIASVIAATRRAPSSSGSVSSSQETKGRQGQMTADLALVAMPSTSDASANIATVTASPLSTSDRQQFETNSEAKQQEHHLQQQLQQLQQDSTLEASFGEKQVLDRKNESPPIAAIAEKARAGNAPANVREAHENG